MRPEEEIRHVGRPPYPPQSEEAFEEFFDLSVDLLSIIGVDGAFRRVNAAFQRTLGFPRDELFSRSALDILHPDDVESARAALGQLAEGRDVVGFEARIVCADGTIRWVEWNTRTMLERGLVYTVGRDTTERRRSEGELQAAQRALSALAAEQAALRRVATEVARGAAPEEVFAAVGREVGEVLGVDATHLGRYDADDSVISVAQWGRYPGAPLGARFPLEGDNVSARVRRTGAPARMDGYAGAFGVIAATVRDLGIRSSIGVPVLVAGRLWGVMIATSRASQPFSAQAESHLEAFTELLATAIANASARAELGKLAEEQAALRRVATLVAEDSSSPDLFKNIVGEIGRLLGVDLAALGRNLDGERMVAFATWAAEGEHPPFAEVVPIGPGTLMWEIVRTGKPARQDDWGGVDNVTATLVRERMGARSSVGAPIMVDGRPWGAIFVHSRSDVLPQDTEARLERFAALVVTALNDAQARAEVQRLADEQAALRRVATLVAHGAAPRAVFDAVTAEVAELFDVSASLARYDDEALTVVANRGILVQIGDRYPLGGDNVTSVVMRTGSTARKDDYADVSGQIGEYAQRSHVGSAVAAPIVVEGRTWGVLVALWRDHVIAPADAEERLARFAELLDTAIGNADSRDQLTASRARVLAAGDDARRRLVRDLHDGAQQRLVQLTLTLRLALRAVRENPAEAEANVERAIKVSQDALADLRELAHGILPSVLTRGGLRAAVRALVSRVDLPIDLEVTEERVQPDIEASAYFIIAEALTNVLKYAQATRASVRASIDGEVLAIEVHDDGVGGADPDGHGLLGIADRVAALGGRLRIRGGEAGGTRVSVRLPISAGLRRDG
jgi:PAS domain S-box-containing protein